MLAASRFWVLAWQNAVILLTVFALFTLKCFDLKVIWLSSMMIKRNHIEDEVVNKDESCLQNYLINEFNGIIRSNRSLVVISSLSVLKINLCTIKVLELFLLRKEFRIFSVFMFWYLEVEWKFYFKIRLPIYKGCYS